MAPAEHPDHLTSLGLRDPVNEATFQPLQPDPQATPETPLVTPDMVEYLRSQFPGDVKKVVPGLEVAMVNRLLGNLEVIDHLETLIISQRK